MKLFNYFFLIFATHFLRRIYCIFVTDFTLYFILLLSLVLKSQPMMFAKNSSFQEPTKITKHKNIDVNLKCLLLDEHESFNKMSTVLWFVKKTSKFPSWNQPEEIEWEEIDCNSPNLKLGDETSSAGIYFCKIFPYQTSRNVILQIEVVKTFQLDIFGETVLNSFKDNFKECIFQFRS